MIDKKPPNRENSPPSKAVHGEFAKANRGDLAKAVRGEPVEP